MFWKTIYGRSPVINSASVAIGGVILTSHALYNGYPLIYSDTGTYIAACFDHFIPKDRPLTYSFFLRHTSLNETLWIPMILQCILVSWLVLLIFRHFTTVTIIWPWHLGTVAILTSCTGIAANTGLLIPDVFTSVMLLSGALLLFAEKINVATQITLHVLFAFAMTTHLSHYPLACFLVTTVFIGWLINRKRPDSRWQFYRILVLGAMVPAAMGLTMLINVSVAGKWQFSPGSGHVFMMNRLLQCGILNQYLNENCATRPNTLCDHRPNMQQDFLWDPNSPLNAHYGWDGWEAAKPEYDRIISEIFSDRQYLLQYVRYNLRDASRQLVTFNVTAMRQLTDGAAYDNLQRRFPYDHQQYLRSRQGRGTMNYDVLNKMQNIFCTIAVIILGILLVVKKFRNRLPRLVPLSLWVIAGMIFNALTVVSVAMVDSRYQSRLIWIIPLIVFCFLAQLLTRKSQNHN